ncbi:hypothetical protein SLA2020_411270 [Shorea laevis]
MPVLSPSSSSSSSSSFVFTCLLIILLLITVHSTNCLAKKTMPLAATAKSPLTITPRHALSWRSSLGLSPANGSKKNRSPVQPPFAFSSMTACRRL